MKNSFIRVFGAKKHNLKDVSVSIPRYKLTTITGLSGSGKSSLAFSTLYAEGQRRYIETFSSFARTFLSKSIEDPEVDKIDGLPSVIAIEQKTTSRNKLSTVGTVTEIYDFMRLLFARIGVPYSYTTNEKMVSYTLDRLQRVILETYANVPVKILAPMVVSRKGSYQELFKKMFRLGFSKARVDGKFTQISDVFSLDRYKTHDVEFVIDEIRLSNEGNKHEKRLLEGIKTALEYGEGMLIIYEELTGQMKYYSRDYMCPTTGVSYSIPEPNTFSFNSVKGACKSCFGMGELMEVSLEKIIPNSLRSIAEGGIEPIGKQNKSWIFEQLLIISKRYEFSLKDPINTIPKQAMQVILNGSKEYFNHYSELFKVTKRYKIEFQGLKQFIKQQYDSPESLRIKNWAAQYMQRIDCIDCGGARLKREALYFKIDGRHIHDLCSLEIEKLLNWFLNLENKLGVVEKEIAKPILKEVIKRLEFLLQMGLGYLTLGRSARSLSGGESQRIRIATQVASQLTEVLYVLDEPSIGLHQRDNDKMIDLLLKLKEKGNSIIVVEHDKDMMNRSDFIIDIGPFSGEQGGKICASGNKKEFLAQNTLTAQYLKDQRNISYKLPRRQGNKKSIDLVGASGNNLKGDRLTIPLGKLIVVTGVSGGGKSTLILETLYKVLAQRINKNSENPLPYERIEGVEHINKVIHIDQKPIGRTSRSNPATYTNLFNHIRDLFSQTIESKIKGYKPSRFSFNVKGGRCEECKGSGLRTVEMSFLPNVYVPCETCQGKRFNRETLKIKFKGKNVFEILDMTIDESFLFFEGIPAIRDILKTLKQVGLGYLKLGQSSTTLSGGEAQRIKLATELSKRDTGNTLLILDEPTTGLHFEDVRVLMEVIDALVDKGNTVLIIEHNMDVIKLADHIVDIGPEAGLEGGRVIAQGTPEQVIKNRESITAKYLKKELMNKLIEKRT